MKITNDGVAKGSINVNEPAQALSKTGKDGTLGSNIPNNDLYIPSQQWLRMQGLLREQPAIRSDRVAYASERLNTGYYLSPESAQKTATAMLHSPD